MGSNVKRSGHSTSRRQRSRRQAPRKPSNSRTGVAGQTVSTTGTAGPKTTGSRQPASFVKGKLELTPPHQTHSWQLLAPSARLWLKNYNICLIVLMLPVLLLTLGSEIAGKVTEFNPRVLFGLALTSLGVIWQTLNLPVVYYMTLRAVRNEQPGILEVYSQGLRFIFRIVGLYVLVTMLAFGGLILLIIPGLIVLRRYFLAPYYLIDQNLGIRQAMARSAADSKPVSKYIWGLIGVYCVIIFGCIITFNPIFPPYGSIVGAFLINLFVFAPALRYKEVALHQTVIEPTET